MTNKTTETADLPIATNIPQVQIGQLVGWSRSLNHADHFFPAVVTQVNEDTLEMNVLGLGMYKTVRHESDPLYKRSAFALENNGLWFELPDSKRMSQIENALASVTADVARLSRALGGKGKASPESRE